MKNNRLSVSLLALLSLGLVACGGTSDNTGTTGGNGSTNSVKAIVEQASNMDAKDLYKKAMDELDGKKMFAVGNSSRGKNGISYFLAYLRGNAYTTEKDADGKDKAVETADENIRAAYPYYNEKFDGKIEWQQPKNNKIFDQISGDIKGAHTFSMTLIQDGAQIQSRMLDTDYLYKYVPKEWKGTEEDSEPLLALQSLNKIFMFNNLDTDKSYTNIWDFVMEDEKPNFMGINSEPVGRNFLVQLTEEKYAVQMKNAYDALDSTKKAYVDQALEAVKDVATTYNLTNTSENVKYSLAFDYLWLKQYQEKDDDGPICNNLVKKTSAGQSGLLVYSKLRSVTETEESSKNNVTVAAYQDNYTGLGGFMYKHYMAVIKTSPLPWTSCAFIHFLTTTENGFAAWGKDIGGYASDEKVRALPKFDHSNDGKADADGKTYPAINDKGYSWWKDKCVVENPEYVSNNVFVTSWFDTLRK